MSIHNATTRLFERKIMDFYRKAGREYLPWRRERISAYEVWVSEIMLQQTQVSRVIEYYVKFLERFPNVSVLAQASWEEFLPYYAGLGYYRRGQNMLLAAKKVTENFGGEFPRDKKLLRTLPGVGEYTASAILSFAYGDNHLAWDTNLKRVMGRFFYGNKDGEEIAAQMKENDEMIFRTPAREMNAAFMDFGSAICLSRPKCKICPLSKRCVYFSGEGVREARSKQQRAHNSQQLTVNGERMAVTKVDWRRAQAYVWLHKDHKLYYSLHPKKFEVFVLPAEYNSRAGIKAYFKDTYALDLSVRPPHAKMVLQGKPTLLVNAQILLGKPVFTTFSKDTVKAYNGSIAI
ncbi:MAG: hypothetical protein PHT88_05600 [Candidatus Moranbacteria bacterium]|nr:hypothetical protein [Candidatus Moranbacteria bacterium]